MDRRHTMEIYDTLIVGCGYGSVGYALARKNTVICDEHQICDTSFYLPMRTFRYTPYAPKTKEGADLQEFFDSFSLFKESVQNVNGFEYAFCKFISEKDLTILLKCRVTDAARGSAAYEEMNSFIEHMQKITQSKS